MSTDCWRILHEETVLEVPWFSVSVQKVRLPDGREIPDYYQINCPDAVVMVPETADREFVMLQQYMHGFRKVSTVFPSGTVSPGESPLETARRELAEETGYTSEDWRLLSSVPGHSSYGCGIIHFFACHGARRTCDPIDNDLESRSVRLLARNAVPHAISSGDICSIGSMAALCLATHVPNTPASAVAEAPWI